MGPCGAREAPIVAGAGEVTFLFTFIAARAADFLLSARL